MPKNKYDYCSECKVKLKRVKQRRTDYKKCAECRGDDIKGASELRAIFKELKKHSSKSKGKFIFSTISWYSGLWCVSNRRR